MSAEVEITFMVFFHLTIKNPSEGQLCYGRPARIYEADSELQITKKKEEATSEEYFSLLTSRLMWLVSTWLRLLLHVRFSFQWCSSRPGSAAVTRVATLSWKSQMRRWTLSVHRWRFFSSRVHGWNTSMCHGLTCSGFESRYGSNILIFNTQRFGKLNAQ